MPDDLQLRRCLPPRDPHHAGDSRGLVCDRGAPGLKGFFDPPDPPEDDEGAGAAESVPLAPGRAPAAPRSLVVRTDGAARGNPGPAAAGAVLIDASRPGARRPDAEPLATISEYLGVQTNNVAEYTAVVRALALADELEAREVDLVLDSMLIVEQLQGRWRVKNARLARLHAEAMERLRRFDRWTVVHAPRAENHAADALCNEAIDRALAGGPAVVIRRP